MNQSEVKTVTEGEWFGFLEESRNIPEIFTEVGRDEFIVEYSDGTKEYKVAVRNNHHIVTGYFSAEL